jgi:peptidyl-prolyl cis-trans isomerase B (cyclophilin B)
VSNRHNRRREQQRLSKTKARREKEKRTEMPPGGERRPLPPWLKFISRWRRPLGLGAVLLAIIVIVVIIVSNGNEPLIENQWVRGDPLPIVTITMEDGGRIIMELYPEKAPNTVNNFVALIQSGFYDGVIFHRVIPSFMVQTGGEGSALEHPGLIRGEFASNGFAANDIRHERGAVSMARSTGPNTGNSQFFICVGSSTHLDGDYAAFGWVLEGIEIADAISRLPRDEVRNSPTENRPHNPPRIRTVTVETHGRAFPAPIRS